MKSKWNGRSEKSYIQSKVKILFFIDCTFHLLQNEDVTVGVDSFTKRYGVNENAKVNATCIQYPLIRIEIKNIV